MARIADFVAIQDHGSTVPHPQTGSRSAHFPPFSAPDVSGSPALLAFLVESKGDVVLRVELNGSVLFDQPFKTEPPRAWHEVISTSIVKEWGNDLKMSVSGAGSVTVRDVVLHFQARVPPRPTPIIAAQDTRYSQPLSCGARRGVIVIAGRHFLQMGLPGTQTLQEFLDVEVDAVKARLDDYLADHPEISRDTTEIMMMDVEQPHPADLHTHAAEVRTRIVDAYETRIEALADTFRNAKLCMYGTLNPDNRGRPDAEDYLPRLEALRAAGDQGLYDRLDYLVPILYPRFGPGDNEGPWTSYRAYTEQGIDGSRHLLKSDKTSLPLLPVTGFRVAGKNTVHKGQLLLDLPVEDPLRHTLGVQLEVMAEKGVREVVFWVGKDSDTLEPPNDGGHTVTDHVCGR